MHFFQEIVSDFGNFSAPMYIGFVLVYQDKAHTFLICGTVVDLAVNEGN